MAFGAASILGLGILSSLPESLRIQKMMGVRLRGVTSYSFMYGFLSLGCSLPLMAVRMLNILSGVDTTSLIARLLAFGIGFATPLAIFTYAAGRGHRVLCFKAWEWKCNLAENRRCDNDRRCVSFDIHLRI